MNKFVALSLVVLFSTTATNATTVCMPINNSTANLGEYAQYVHYDFSYTDDPSLTAARQALATQRTSSKYLIARFTQGLIAASIYPKCDTQSGAIYQDTCTNDLQYCYCCNGGASVVAAQPVAFEPSCTPIYYQGVPVHSYYGSASHLAYSAALLALAMVTTTALL